MPVKSKKEKKSKKKLHATYNNKQFLAPGSITSMSAIHTKIYSDGIAIIRISDCHNSIKVWNDLNNLNEVEEMLNKIDTLSSMLKDFRAEVAVKLPDIYHAIQR